MRKCINFQISGHELLVCNLRKLDYSLQDSIRIISFTFISLQKTIVIIIKETAQSRVVCRR